MFKVASRYLSGVSVFLGDDITKRETNGEIAVIVGQATSGPNEPIQLKSPENAIAIYGQDNPLTKALFQFVDGYNDSPKKQYVNYVTMRIGGIKTAIATSYGLAMESSDAYTGLEDDFFIFVDDTSAESAKVKIWDANKLLVLDTEADIDAQYWVINSLPTGTSGKLYGVDIDNDPLATPVSIADLVKLDVTYKGAGYLTVAASGGIAVGATSIVATEDVSLWPLEGTLVLTQVNGALTISEQLPYTLDVATKTFTLTGGATVANAYTNAVQIGVIGTIITKGDSELDLSNREVYEKMRNALLEVEMFTPDYIAPGVEFDAVDSYAKTYIETTQLVTNAASNATTITVDAAATWPTSGKVTLYDGTNTVETDYTAITPSGANYVVTLKAALGKAFAANATLVTVTFDKIENFELGIGFVKETDMGDHFEFDWSDVKLPGYYIAHFGYLIANFCNTSAVGYNTPLFGMNVRVPFTSTPTRTQLVEWIGQFPTYGYQAGNIDAIQLVKANGKGLLGNAVLAGSKTYNRCYMSNPSRGEFADPAYGLLMTDQGFVDGNEIKDDNSNLVDLGKFGCVGAGLLTFTNRGASNSYIDSMGIYTLGLIAGLPKNEGASFRRIAVGSSVQVSVIISRNLCNDLAKLGYIVPTREKGLGWVVNNDTSIARNDSAYFLLSTTRTVKYVVEAKRAILVGYIGKPINTYNYEAARTKLADSFAGDVASGMLNGFTFDLLAVDTASVMGKLLLNCSLNPPLELVQVDVNAVIDRNVTNTK